MKIQGVIEAMPRFFIYVECQLNKNTMELLIGCKTELINSPIAKCRDVGWQGRPSRQLQVLADQLTLSQPDGADCAPPPHTVSNMTLQVTSKFFGFPVKSQISGKIPSTF